MRNAKQIVDIIVTWKESASSVPSEPDADLVRELARELGRMAARHDIAMARRRASEASQRTPADLGSKACDVVR